MAVLNRILRAFGLMIVPAPVPHGVFLVDRAGRCVYQP